MTYCVINFPNKFLNELSFQRRVSAMKIARHAKILELIETYEIETQDELAQKL